MIADVAKTAKYIVALGLALAACSAASGAVVARRYGAIAYETSALAALVNWVAGSLGLGIVGMCRHQPWRAQSVLLAMAVRMAIPLGAVAFFLRSQHPWAVAGVAGLIVVHYLVGLVMETLMSVRLVADGTQERSAAPGSARPPGPGTARLA